MDYFVSSDNSAFNRWQLELLIESFKFFGLDNDLAITLCDVNENNFDLFKFNINNHKRKNFNANFGLTRGYQPLSFLYNLYYAVRSGLVNLQFASISSSTVLKEPLKIDLSDEFAEIFIESDFTVSLDDAIQNVGNFWEIVGKSKSDFESFWMPFSSVMVFNKIPEEIFQRSILMTEKLCLMQLLSGREIWKHTDKLAWCLNLHDFQDMISVRADLRLTENMMESGDSPFINYDFGFPPIFTKQMFAYKPPTFSAFGNPFEVLSTMATPSKNSYIMSELAKRVLDLRPKNW